MNSLSSKQLRLHYIQSKLSIVVRYSYLQIVVITVAPLSRGLDMEVVSEVHSDKVPFFNIYIIFENQKNENDLPIVRSDCPEAFDACRVVPRTTDQ